MTSKIPIILARFSDRAISKNSSSDKNIRLKSQLVISETTKGLAAEMKNALALLVLLNSIFLMSCELTQEDIEEVMRNRELPKRYCGAKLHEAIYQHCQPLIFQALNRRFKKSIDFSGGGSKVDNTFEQYPVGYYHDEDIQSDEGGNGYDMVPNFILDSHYSYSKRDGITKVCCAVPCTIDTLIQYCPRKGNRKY